MAQTGYRGGLAAAARGTQRVKSGFETIAEAGQKGIQVASAIQQTKKKEKEALENKALSMSSPYYDALAKVDKTGGGIGFDEAVTKQIEEWAKLERDEYMKAYGPNSTPEDKQAYLVNKSKRKAQLEQLTVFAGTFDDQYQNMTNSLSKAAVNGNGTAGTLLGGTLNPNKDLGFMLDMGKGQTNISGFEFDANGNMMLKGSGGGTIDITRWNKNVKDGQNYFATIDDDIMDQFNTQGSNLYKSYTTEFGDPKMTITRTEKVKVPKVDSKGNKVLDANGQPVMTEETIQYKQIQPGDRSKIQKSIYDNIMQQGFKGGKKAGHMDPAQMWAVLYNTQSSQGQTYLAQGNVESWYDAVLDANGNIDPARYQQASDLLANAYTEWVIDNSVPTQTRVTDIASKSGTGALNTK